MVIAIHKVISAGDVFLSRAVDTMIACIPRHSCRGANGILRGKPQPFAPSCLRRQVVTPQARMPSSNFGCAVFAPETGGLLSSSHIHTQPISLVDVAPQRARVQGKAKY